MNTNAVEFSKRLAIAMEEAGFAPKASVLEREFSLRYWGKAVTLQGVRRWLRGESIPSEDKLETLAEWLKVDKRYLRFGEWSVKQITEDSVRWDARMNDEERKIIASFMALPPDKRKIVGEVVRAFEIQMQNHRQTLTQ